MSCGRMDYLYLIMFTLASKKKMYVFLLKHKPRDEPEMNYHVNNTIMTFSL